MRHRLPNDLEVADFPAGGKAVKTPEGFTLAWGDTDPTDQGYAPGCIFVNTTTGAIKKNTGTALSAVWAADVNADELQAVTPGVGVYGVPFVIAQPFTNLPATGANIFTDCPFDLRVIDAWSVASTADGGTWTLHKGIAGDVGNAMTDTVTVAAADGANAIDRASEIIVAEHEVAAGGGMCAVGDAEGALDVIIYILCIRI